MAKRFFRPHRGLYSESMEYKIEVYCLQDIIARIEDAPLVVGYYRNIRIAPDTRRDHREPCDEWGKDTYMVVADFCGYTGQCIGYANFCDDDVKDDGVILLGKPLGEYPETSAWTAHKIKKTGLADYHNIGVFRRRYGKRDYEDIGRTIVMDGNSFRTTEEIIAYTRLFAGRILCGADMTPIIPFIEEGLRFNIDYAAMLERVAPIFDEFEKYGGEGKYTIDHRFHLEFWQGRFSRHWSNPEKKPVYK